MDEFQRATTKSTSKSVGEKIRAFLLPIIVLALILLLVFQFYLMGKTPVDYSQFSNDATTDDSSAQVSSWV